MKQKFITYRGAIRPSEVNGKREMILQTYIDRTEQSGRTFFAMAGINKAFLTEHNAGVAVVEHDIKFEAPIFEDDLIYIETQLLEFRDKVFLLYHEIKDANSHDIRYTAKVTTLLFDLSKRKALSLPEKVRIQFEKML